MTKDTQEYSMAGIYQLSVEAFNAETLKRYCRWIHSLAPILAEFGACQGVTPMADAVLEYRQR